MIVLGLTGSIGMGKSTTAAMFADCGIPVNEADKVVHDLYRHEAVAPIEAAFSGVVYNGNVDRQALADQLSANPLLFETLEAVVHPLVRDKERAFLDRNRALGASLVVLDIPLLFETGGESRVDAVAVATCDWQTQHDRVMKRPGMTEEKFALILSRQMPDAQKRLKADYIIETGHGLPSARAAVASIVRSLSRN